MKYLLLLILMLACVGCGNAEIPKPTQTKNTTVYQIGWASVTFFEHDGKKFALATGDGTSLIQIKDE